MDILLLGCARLAGDARLAGEEEDIGPTSIRIRFGIGIQ